MGFARRFASTPLGLLAGKRGDSTDLCSRSWGSQVLGPGSLGGGAGFVFGLGVSAKPASRGQGGCTALCFVAQRLQRHVFGVHQRVGYLSGVRGIRMKSDFFIRLRWVLSGIVGFFPLLAVHAVSPPPSTWPVGNGVDGETSYVLSCAFGGCHGSGTSFQNNAGRAAGPMGATTLNNAILNNIGNMGFLSSLTAQTLSDINVYLSTPSLNLVSPPVGGAVPTSLSFAPTGVGLTQSATVTFTAWGGTVNLTSLTAAPSIYSLTGGSCAAGQSLVGSQSCTAIVTFSPSQVGASPAGTLVFGYTVGSTPANLTLSLSGSGVTAPLANVVPAKLSFAADVVGATGASQSVSITNGGNGSLTLSAPSVSSPNFQITGGSCGSGASLGAGASCTVHIGFTPGVSGALSGQLILTHNGGGAGAQMESLVPLSGVAVTAEPVLAISPSSLNFSHSVGSTSTTQSVTLSNHGAGVLSLPEFTLQGADSSQFSRSGGSCGASLIAGSSCTVGVTFTPLTPGTLSASMVLAHNAAGSPSTVSLTGLATAGASPVVSLNAAAVTFAAQAINTSSSSQTVTLTNTGSAALSFSALALGGQDAASFLLSGGGSCALNVAVAPGGSCTLAMVSRPASEGAKVAHLSIISNGVVGVVTLPVLGRGLAVAAPSVVWTPNAVDFVRASLGGAAQARQVRLSNVGGSALNVTSLGLLNATGVSQTNNCGSSVAAGGFCTVTLSYAPTNATPLSGLLRLASNAPGSPHEVGLNGLGAISAPVLDWDTTPDGVFADIAVGSVSSLKTFTLRNTSTSTAATISAVQALGAEQGEFVLGGTCLSTPTVAASATCTVTVAMAPSVIGARSASLVIRSPGVAPTPVDLSGRGYGLAQNALGVDLSLTFAQTPVGSTAAVPLTLTNTGTMALALGGFSTSSGIFSSALSMQPGCVAVPLLLAPGASCVLDVTYRPVSLAAISENLLITTNLSSLSQVALLANVPAPKVETVHTNVGSGGCSLVSAEGSRPDPTLLLLCLTALVVLWRRSTRTEC